MIGVILGLLSACSTFEAEYECTVGAEVEVTWSAEIGCLLPDCATPHADELLSFATEADISYFRTNYFSVGDPIPDDVPAGSEFVIQGLLGVEHSDTSGAADPTVVEDFRESDDGKKIFARMAAASKSECQMRVGPEGNRAWLVHSTLPAEPCWKCKTE